MKLTIYEAERVANIKTDIPRKSTHTFSGCRRNSFYLSSIWRSALWPPLEKLLQFAGVLSAGFFREHREFRKSGLQVGGSRWRRICIRRMRRRPLGALKRALRAGCHRPSVYLARRQHYTQTNGRAHRGGGAQIIAYNNVLMPVLFAALSVPKRCVLSEYNGTRCLLSARHPAVSADHTDALLTQFSRMQCHCHYHCTTIISTPDSLAGFVLCALAADATLVRRCGRHLQELGLWILVTNYNFAIEHDSASVFKLSIA
jgi:hypothetical protein